MKADRRSYGQKAPRGGFTDSRAEGVQARKEEPSGLRGALEKTIRLQADLCPGVITLRTGKKRDLRGKSKKKETNEEALQVRYCFWGGKRVR